jgi:hypothetical protein
LERTGQPALAARILLPLLEPLSQDSDLLETIRRESAVEIGERMFEAFANARDYRTALALAQRIDQNYPGSAHHEAARRLVAELPQRMGDFAELKLPTPAQWRVLRQSLTRTEQIDFLCRRLRLINGPACFLGLFACWLDHQEYAETAGAGHPDGRFHGGYHPLPPDVAARANGKGRTRVINPFAELKNSVKLTLADVPLLVPCPRE